eukprot:365526-Chlamydomonas_euryale.AAC.11
MEQPPRRPGATPTRPDQTELLENDSLNIASHNQPRNPVRTSRCALLSMAWTRGAAPAIPTRFSPHPPPTHTVLFLLHWPLQTQ